MPFPRFRPPTSSSPILLLLSGLLTGCPSAVLSQYEEARTAALADPGPVPSDWRPDAALYLSPELLDRLLVVVLEEHGTLRDEITVSIPLGGRLTLKPDLTVQSIDLQSTTRCEDCLAVDVTLTGPVAWRAGRATGDVPITAHAEFDTAFESTSDGEGTWTVTARPRDVRDLDLDLGGTTAMLEPLLESTLGDWFRAELLQRIPPINLGSFGNEDVPLRAVRVASARKGLAVGLLTGSPTPETLEEEVRRARQGWRLDISEDSLLDLAKAASFRAGPVSHDVVIEPTALSFTPDGFALEMRLWRPVGRGWWRDYSVQGQLEVKKRRVVLTPTTVEEGPKSKGAFFVDPLATLGEGRILEAIEDSINTAVPTHYATTAEGLQLSANLTGLQSANGMVTLRGDLEIARAKRKPRTGPRRPR
ncbi:MAG: hypothetical protein JRI25_06135 [Deltaproteobacteria bacterium]|nr:hypothetical protein [Deltaproteobacteria bacterium]MBW2254163.1 hypothetical protein [Deltaproteobacteria bacterium]